MADQRHVYAWLEGQFDNIGDSALRRAYAQALTERGHVVMWGGNHPGYNAGLGGVDGAELEQSYLRWLRSLYADVLAGRADVALNAGQFGISKEFAKRLSTIVPALVLNRVRGGGNLWLGAASTPRWGRTRLIRALARLATQVSWRDEASSRTIYPAPVMPDWAFSLEPGGRPAGRRGRLAVSLRGDRPAPSERWIAAVGGLAARLALRPTVVVQVARDEDRAAELAASLGADLVSWGSGDHAEQESRVRTVYRDSRVILSDRLHALIIGMTEGAVPLGWCEHTNDKVARHFDVIGMGWVGADDAPDQALGALDDDRVAELSRRADRGLADARERLGDLRAGLGRRAGAATAR